MRQPTYGTVSASPSVASKVTAGVARRHAVKNLLAARATHHNREWDPQRHATTPATTLAASYERRRRGQPIILVTATDAEGEGLTGSRLATMGVAPKRRPATMGAKTEATARVTRRLVDAAAPLPLAAKSISDDGCNPGQLRACCSELSVGEETVRRLCRRTAAERKV